MNKTVLLVLALVAVSYAQQMFTVTFATDSGQAWDAVSFPMPPQPTQFVVGIRNQQGNEWTDFTQNLVPTQVSVGTDIIVDIYI
jgi:hypothetical protein